MRAIDIHTHPVFFRSGYSAAEADRLAAGASALGVRHMICLGDVLVYGPRPNEKQVRTINDQTAQLLRWRPDYFTGFCGLNPVLGERAVQREVERCAALGFKGIKLEISNNAREACMKPVMHAAARFGLPVLQHTWSMTHIRQRHMHSDPEDTALLARRFPNVRIIMAHLTGCGYRGILEAKGIDNLVVDTSGGYPEAGLLDFALEHLGADHIVYGSDLPIRETSVTLNRILGTKMSTTEREKILYGNTARLLQLAP
ncbi:amidohydrolase family protein [Horticoccus luteus]|uniref:Amidohydrolase family protein n=1 Tax=Horticoccus luteus TaxID=2862869 RepID=A0A8F9TS35_9BACT|nr:amidohydrolase family protein [Horticoccus luteus]QYM78000.1 amidohydrolase family protein [Horticoccus luteus]